MFAHSNGLYVDVTTVVVLGADLIPVQCGVVDSGSTLQLQKSEFESPEGKRFYFLIYSGKIACYLCMCMPQDL